MDCMARQKQEYQADRSARFFAHDQHQGRVPEDGGDSC